MKYYIETISPLYIGSGNKYSNNEFIIKGKQLIRTDIGKLYESLKEEGSKSDFIFGLEQPTFSLKEFIGNDPIPSEAVLYTATLSNEKLKPLEIAEHIKTNNSPFIPASSIKGAIRTTILYHLIKEEDIYDLQYILNNPNKKLVIKQIKEKLDSMMAGNTKNTASSDLLRFLQVSDSKNVNKIEIISEQVLEGQEFGKWGWHIRNGKIVQSYLEALSPNIKIDGDININYDHKLFKNLELGDKANLINYDKIKEIIYNFSKDIISHELDFAKKYNIDFLLAFYDKIQKLNTKKEPLIKIGHGSGFLATTIWLKLKNDFQLFDKIRNLTKGKSYQYEFPKSRKVDIDRNIPIGWCKLDIR